MTDLYTYNALITAVHDGDTVTCDIDLGFNIWVRSQSLRFLGINCPEMSTPEGTVARDALIKILGTIPSPTVIRTYKDRREKFGRWLALVFIKPDSLDPDASVNRKLLDGGFAVRYHPGMPDPFKP